MTTEAKQELEILIRGQKLGWLDHPHTKLFMKQLEDFRNRMVMEAEEMSQNVPLDINSVLSKLNAAYTARKITELATKN